MTTSGSSASDRSVPADSAAVHGRDAARPAGVRVLIAEDDHDIRIALEQLLLVAGYDVDCVSTGADLLGYMSSWILTDGTQRDPPVDIIVTDVRMPGFNGLNIVEGLRAHGFRKPVVVMTAFSDDTMKERVERMGGATLIAKPFDPSEFEQLLSSLVPRKTPSA